MSPAADPADDAGGAEEDEPGGLRDETEPPLLLYSLLHDEVRSRLTHHYRSLLSGLSVIGVIIAYALLSGEFVFLAVVPVVIGFLVVQTVRQLNGLLFISHHLCRIEGAYVEEYPLFSWARRYGMTGTERRVERHGIDWSLVPAAIVLAFGALGYLGFVYVSYVVWPPDGIDILVVGLTREGLLGIYVVLTTLVCLAGYAYYRHRAAFPAGGERGRDGESEE